MTASSWFHTIFLMLLALGWGPLLSSPRATCALHADNINISYFATTLQLGRYQCWCVCLPELVVLVEDCLLPRGAQLPLHGLGGAGVRGTLAGIITLNFVVITVIMLMMLRCTVWTHMVWSEAMAQYCS